MRYPTTTRPEGLPMPGILEHLPISQRELIRFLKFALVGALGTVIDFSLLNLFHFGLGWPKGVANTASVFVAVLSNFTWNRLWTFPESRRRPLRSQLPMFLSVYAVGYLLNQALFLGSYTLIFGPRFAPALAVNLAKALANLLGLFWNFGANRLSTYRGL